MSNYVGMDSKICTGCGDPKLLEDYYAIKGRGQHSKCKMCYKEGLMNYRHTKDGLIAKIYSSQKVSSMRKGYDPPYYTKQELTDWLFSQSEFHELYDVWAVSGYKTDLSPSCDRPDDYEPYTLDNLQLMTWVENNKKSHLDRKNGINNKGSVAVVGILAIRGKEMVFHSIAEAGRQTGIDVSSISKCCRGRLNMAGGYEWRYKDDE